MIYFRKDPSPTSILLIAEHPAFVVVEITDEDEDFEVWGVVTYAIHKLQAPTRKVRREINIALH
jgi:hypothetical protein